MLKRKLEVGLGLTTTPAVEQWSWLIGAEQWFPTLVLFLMLRSATRGGINTDISSTVQFIPCCQ